MTARNRKQSQLLLESRMGLNHVSHLTCFASCCCCPPDTHRPGKVGWVWFSNVQSVPPGKYFWRLTRNKHLVSLQLAQIHRFWRGLLLNLESLDAVYKRTSDHKIVFFKGESKHGAGGIECVARQETPVPHVKHLECQSESCCPWARPEEMSWQGGQAKGNGHVPQKMSEMSLKIKFSQMKQKSFQELFKNETQAKTTPTYAQRWCVPPLTLSLFSMCCWEKNNQRGNKNETEDLQF